jgi:hypothetical protein
MNPADTTDRATYERPEPSSLAAVNESKGAGGFSFASLSMITNL